MDDLCTGCLCSGRNLYFIGETEYYHLYSEILNEIQVYDAALCVRVCWECRALLRRFQQFKSQVKQSYTELLRHMQLNTPKHTLCKPPHLSVHHISSTEYPLEVKEEYDFEINIDNIKTETIDIEEHCEPETFVNGLDVRKSEDTEQSSFVFVTMDEAEENNCTPEEITLAAQEVTENLISEKSKMSYKKAYDKFIAWKVENKVESFSENVLLAYFKNLHPTFKPTSLWVEYSKLKSTISIYNQTDISKYSKLLAFLKQRSEDYKPKKAQTFSPEDLNKFLNEAPDELYLLAKVTKKKAKKKIKGIKKKKKLKLLEEPKSDGLSDRDIAEQENEIENEVENEVEYKVDESFICSDCGLPFNDKTAFETHIQKEHIKVEISKTVSKVRTKSKEVLAEKPQCTECGKVFSSRKTYRYHLNVLHKGQNRYPCPRCGKVYQWKSNLGRHLRTHKARDDGELYCALCDKRFASVATYRQHLRVSRSHVSESEFSFVCNECGKKFVSKTRLRDHVDWEHLKKIKFRCQLCNKPFKCHTSLYVHMQNVHRNKEKKDNLCHVCGKSYQNAAKLKYHIVAMHTSETPYQCGQCAAAFGWYSSLYRHIREVHYKMKVQPKKSKKGKKLPDLTRLNASPASTATEVASHFKRML